MTEEIITSLMSLVVEGAKILLLILQNKHEFLKILASWTYLDYPIGECFLVVSQPLQHPGEILLPVDSLWPGV